MRIFGFNISRQSPATRTKAADSDLTSWLRGEESRGGISLSNAYEQVVWVYRAIGVLAEQIGNIPFLFSAGDRGRENLITTGPLIDFYNQPHPQINRFQYWELRLIWLMLRGECFRIPIYDSRAPRSPLRASRFSRIIMPDPAHFRHIIHEHELIGWRYTGFGPNTPLASQVFLPEEVWFEKLPNPFNFWRGLAPLEVAGMAAQTDFAAGSFMKGVMENNGDMGLIVRVQEQAGAEQREQLKAALRDRKRRAGRADGPLLLWNTAEIVQPRLSSSDLQFLENRKFSRAEICAAFGVPEEIVTTTDNSKYDVVEGARLNFIEHRVAPLCRRLEASEEVTVKTLHPGAVGWFDLDSLPIMQRAQRDRLASARSVFDMGVPFNELNRVLDLGFRRLPWGDRGYVAARLTEVGRERQTVQGTMGEVRETSTEPFERMRTLLEKVASSPRPSPPGEEREKIATSPQVQDVISLSSPGGEGRGEEAVFSYRPEHARSLAPEQGTPVPIHHGQIEASLSSASAPDFDRELTSRLRRFFFEQRSRVLSNLANAPAMTGQPTQPCFDLVFEAKAIEALTFPNSLCPEQEPRLREWLRSKVHEIGQAVIASVAEGMAQHETTELLAERIRKIYNGISSKVRARDFHADGPRLCRRSAAES